MPVDAQGRFVESHPSDLRHPERQPVDPDTGRSRCVADSKSRPGERCLQPTVAGARVCHFHGGASPHVRRNARLRLAELVDPAIMTLGRAMAADDSDWSTRVRAAEAVLDRAGYPRRATIDVEVAREALVARIDTLAAEHALPASLPAPDTEPDSPSRSTS